MKVITKKYLIAVAIFSVSFINPFLFAPEVELPKVKLEEVSINLEKTKMELKNTQKELKDAEQKQEEVQKDLENKKEKEKAAQDMLKNIDIGSPNYENAQQVVATAQKELVQANNTWLDGYSKKSELSKNESALTQKVETLNKQLANLLEQPTHAPTKETQWQTVKITIKNVVNKWFTTVKELISKFLGTQKDVEGFTQAATQVTEKIEKLPVEQRSSELTNLSENIKEETQALTIMQETARPEEEQTNVLQNLASDLLIVRERLSAELGIKLEDLNSMLEQADKALEKLSAGKEVEQLKTQIKEEVVKVSEVEKSVEQPVAQQFRLEVGPEVSALDLLQIIRQVQTRDFSIKSYLTEKPKFNEWNLFLEAVKNYFNDPGELGKTYKKKIDDVYKDQLEQIKKISASLETSIINLREGRDLDSVKENLEADLEYLNTIVKDSFDTIMQDPKKGEKVEDWEVNLEGKKVSDVFVDVDNFLKDFFEATSPEKQKTIVLKYAPNKKFDYALEEILEKLTQVTYLEKKKSFLTRNRSRLQTSIETLNVLNKQYPDMQYTYVRNRMQDTQDKPSMIIFGTADSLRQGLKMFEKDLKNKLTPPEIPGSE